MEQNNLSSAEMPHIGMIMDKYLKAKRIRKAVLARMLNLSGSNFLKKRKKNDIEIGWLWKVSQKLQHNFIADIAALLPPEYSGALQDTVAAKDQEINALKAQLEKAISERELYRELLKK